MPAPPPEKGFQGAEAQGPPEESTPAASPVTPANPADPARAIGQRAKALFESREALCSEAILCALAESFGGELTPERAKALASPFPEGLGRAGCLCGAVSGGALGLGVYLSAALPRRQVREAARGLHDAFKAANKATCCRVLCKHVEQGSAEHFAQCAGFTGQAGEMAARIILDKRPELARGVDAGAFTKKPSGLASFLRRVADWIG